MEILNKQLNLDEFYERLASTDKRLLMLDYDGTLAPFTTERDAAVPYPQIKETLLELLDHQTTRVVIISGRTVDDLKKLLDSEKLPEIWGCHGLERLTLDGHYSIPDFPEEMRSKLSDLYSWTAEKSLVNFCEFKPSGAAYHWRGLPEDEAEQIHKLVYERWHDIAESTNLELYEFDGGQEIRVAGTKKSTPVQKLLDEADPDTITAYLGDDRTDEDAFEALKGRGLSVFVKDTLRETGADIWITPPNELNDFLKRWL